MKKYIFMGLLLLFAMVPKYDYGQNSPDYPLYGLAGQNSAENYNAEVRRYINEMIPAGGSYVADFTQYKFTGRAPTADIQNMISLNRELEDSGKHFYMIYSFDARAIQSLTDNFYAYHEFVESGVSIIACRMGNEEWAKDVGHNFNWDLYQTHFTPIIAELNRLGYSGKILFPIRRPAEGGAWNESARQWIATNVNFEPDVHPYWNKEYAPVLAQIEDGRKLTPETVRRGVYLASKDAFYWGVYAEITAGTLFTAIIDYHKANYPGKRVWFTEYGPAVGVGPIGGALGYEGTTDWFLNQVKANGQYIAAACKFNGPGTISMITPVNTKLDSITGSAWLKRTGYYTMGNFLKNINATSISQINEPGTYVFGYHNMLRESKTFGEVVSMAQGLELQSIYFEGITGENFYSSSGAEGWWKEGSDRTYDIKGVGAYSSIPALSYGYIHATVRKSFVPIYGCTDPLALNYNPDANTDNGTCYYQRDCRCGDPLATNYDPDAPCYDNGLCTYPPPPKCMKKRWLFSGCKEAKSNCNCN